MNHFKEAQKNKPSLAIDFKRSRIRIHKQTLYLLGRPDYLQFLVNPGSHQLAIRSSSNHRDERIRWNRIDENQCCEFYSKILMQRLHCVLFPTGDNILYKIYGQYSESENLVYFLADEAFPISK